MSTIPTGITEKQFKAHIGLYFQTAKRGYVSKIPLYKIFNYILYWLRTGCQWPQLPIEPDLTHPEKREISYYAIYHHYRKCKRLLIRFEQKDIYFLAGHYIVFAMINLQHILA